MTENQARDAIGLLEPGAEKAVATDEPEANVALAIGLSIAISLARLADDLHAIAARGSR